MLLQIIRHLIGKFSVIISGQTGLRTVDQYHFPAVSLKCLRQLYADITCTDHCDALYALILQTLNHILSILEQLYELYIFKLHSLDGRTDRE